jgi:DNA modification methylase
MTTTPINKIKSNPNNPRVIKDDKFKKLVQSLKDLPEMAQVRPIVVNQDMIVLGGNMRLKAMKEAGWKEAPVAVVDWDEDKQRQFIIKDNVGFGEWDWDMLANEWDAESLGEWGLDVPQMNETEIEAEEDDFDVPEGGIATDIVLGDLFEIGEHRLLCGDSGIVENLDKLMNGDKADMVFTDPPYGMNYIPNHNKQRENNKKGITYNNVRHQEMVIGDDEDYNPSFLMQYFDECKEQFWWGADYYIDKINEFKEGNLIVWNKRFGIEDMNWSSSHFELCFSRQAHLKEVVNIKWFGVQGTEKQDVRTRIHTTQKPIQLPAWFIEKHGKNANIIVDIYLGSGTTMVASHQLNRKCYGMELDPKYCQVIIDRMLKLDPSLTIKRNGEKYIRINEITT